MANTSAKLGFDNAARAYLDAIALGCSAAVQALLFEELARRYRALDSQQPRLGDALIAFESVAPFAERSHAQRRAELAQKPSRTANEDRELSFVTERLAEIEERRAALCAVFAAL